MLIPWDFRVKALAADDDDDDDEMLFRLREQKPPLGGEEEKQGAAPVRASFLRPSNLCVCVRRQRGFARCRAFYADDDDSSSSNLRGEPLR